MPRINILEPILQVLVFFGKLQGFNIGAVWCFIILNLFIRDAHTIGLIKYQDPYPFGVDPSWRGSRSELSFLNSLKMKMSILFGVAHMNLGIILSYFNAHFFQNSLDIRCPTLLSDLCSYYYAILLIVDLTYSLCCYQVPVCATDDFP